MYENDQKLELNGPVILRFQTGRSFEVKVDDAKEWLHETFELF